MTTFTFHEDPGHGWLEVTKADCYACGLALAQFSRYSYRDGTTLYLEEDCDAPKFIQHWVKSGREFSDLVVYEDPTPIRNLPRIT